VTPLDRRDGGGEIGSLLDADADDDERSDEQGLRPRSLDDFVGQPDVVGNLRVLLGAARRRFEPADHMLFAGPPGLGKTTLAMLIAAEMGAALKMTTGPSLVKPGDAVALLSSVKEGTVVFIDEVHRIPRQVEEVLYPAMEDFALDVAGGGKTIRLRLPPFTLVGATTRTGLLTGPLRDRFGYVGRLELYGDDDLASIVSRSAGILGVDVDDDAARLIASRSRGTPRIANRLLRRVRDWAEMQADGRVDAAVAEAGLAAFGVDALGLDKVDRLILDVLCNRSGGRPMGLRSLAQAVGEEPETVEDAYEPHLVRLGLVLRTAQGRVAAPDAYRHLGLAPPSSLF
jgi:Holliday junction DNA helicase RuvB